MLEDFDAVSIVRVEPSGEVCRVGPSREAAVEGSIRLELKHIGAIGMGAAPQVRLSQSPPLKTCPCACAPGRQVGVSGEYPEGQEGSYFRPAGLVVDEALRSISVIL